MYYNNTEVILSEEAEVHALRHNTIYNDKSAYVLRYFPYQYKNYTTRRRIYIYVYK